MINKADFSVYATGDVCVGDTILFEEAVFEGSYRRPKFAGDRRIAAEVIGDSYGSDKQQHTFSLLVIDSDGYDACIGAGRLRARLARNGGCSGSSP